MRATILFCLLAWCTVQLLSCVSVAPGPRSDEARWRAPDLDRATRVLAGPDQKEIDLEGMLDQLVRAEVVFLGETHLDETTHRVELRVLEGLARRTGNRVVLAMEMFERDVQPALDSYLAGELTEQEFLKQSRPWGNYRTAYRPLIEAARRLGLPVVASNAPTGLRRKIAMGGKEAWDALTDEERALLPKELLPNSSDYWERVDNAIRGHMHGTGGDPETRLYSTQCLWDNSMGEACVSALEQHPGHMVLHVNGGFHSDRWDGTARQLLLRRPETRVRTITVLPTTSLATATTSSANRADYVVLAESRARDISDGEYAVTVSREMNYRLHLPASATDDDPVPLLIWLCDDGLTAADGLSLWRRRLGEEAAIIAVEPLHEQVGDDLAPAGSWYRAGSLSDDLGSLHQGLERIAGYALRNLPIDSTAVVLSGEGTGATIATSAALYADLGAVRAVALRPAGLRELKNQPLPLRPESSRSGGPADRSLLILVEPHEQEAWSGEVEQYARTELDAGMELMADDRWQRHPQLEAALRVRLGLEPLADDGSNHRFHVRLPHSSGRARHWALLRLLDRAGASGCRVAVLDPEHPAEVGDSQEIDVTIRGADFADGRGLPRAPGPFGGTTLVVVDGDDPAELESWQQRVEEKVLNERSRFHRLRTATEETLAEALQQLASEKRRNVLIVPARFCASADLMRRLRDAARRGPADMTLHWSPGLGGARGLSEPGEG